MHVEIIISKGLVWNYLMKTQLVNKCINHSLGKEVFNEALKVNYYFVWVYFFTSIVRRLN